MQLSDLENADIGGCFQAKRFMNSIEDRYTTKYIILNKIDNLQEFLKEIINDFSKLEIEDTYILVQLYTMPAIEKEFDNANNLHVKRQYLLQ